MWCLLQEDAQQRREGEADFGETRWPLCFVALTAEAQTAFIEKYDIDMSIYNRTNYLVRDACGAVGVVSTLRVMWPRVGLCVGQRLVHPPPQAGFVALVSCSSLPTVQSAVASVH